MLFSLVFVARAKNRLAVLVYFSLAYFPVAMGNVTSFIRYLLLAFPFLAIALLRVYPKWNYVYVLPVFLGLQIYFAWRFALNLWIG